MDLETISNALISNLDLILTIIFTVGVFEFLKYLYRQHKLKKPIESHFLIPRKEHIRLNYVEQDDTEHHVNKIILPSNSICSVILWNKPKINFHENNIQFACSKDYKTRPRAIKWFSPYVKKGKMRKDSPKTNEDHYIDWWNNYHINTEYDRIRDYVYMTGFLVHTFEEGEYKLKTYYHTPTKGGKSELEIQVKDSPYLDSISCVKYKQDKKYKGKKVVLKLNSKINVKNNLKSFLFAIRNILNNERSFSYRIGKLVIIKSKLIYVKFDFLYHFEHNIIFRK